MASPASNSKESDGLAPIARIPASEMAHRANNPIRKITETLKKPDMPEKPHIALSLGDPTVFGNFPTTSVLKSAIEASLHSGKHDGYVHSAGTPEARRAVAKWMSVPGYEALTESDIVLASGCSGALDLAISVLLNPGDNLLIPKPAFPLYETLCTAKAIAVKHYNLLPERQWEADVAHLESLIDARTRAILVNNPSNPCGSVYSEAHLAEIVAVAERHGLPIIADEIYGNLVFASRGAAFHPLASLSPRVPVLATGGIAKEFLVPGWRVGWVAIHDRHGSFAEVRSGLFALSQLLLGANSLVASALPAILDPTAGSAEAKELADFRDRTLARLEENASFLSEKLAAIPGTRVITPQGAMYVMLGITPSHFSDIADDVEFSRLLLAEENVFLLPGAAFGIPNYCRIVFCAPKERLGEAADRIAAFCSRHAAGAIKLTPLPATAEAAVSSAASTPGGADELLSLPHASGAAAAV